MIGVYTLPVLVSYMGLFCAFLASLLALGGNIRYAVIFFILAGLFDLFDGMVARLLNKTDKEKIFGVQIDSIIDVCSFGVAPIIIAYALGMNAPLDFVLMFAYVSAAAMRLSYFNYLVISSNEEGPVKYYTGLPVTYSTIIFPLVILLKICFDADIFSWLLRGAFILVTILFVSNIKIPKPKGIFYIIFPILSFIYALLVLLWL